MLFRPQRDQAERYFLETQKEKKVFEDLWSKSYNFMRENIDTSLSYTVHIDLQDLEKYL